MCGEKPGMLITVQYSPNSEAWWWQHHAVGCFSAAGTGRLVVIEGKMNAAKVQGYPGRKPSPECSGPQTGPKVLPSNKTMTLSTQLK